MFTTNFKTKYRANKKEYNGRIYHSKLEAENALWLDVMLSDRKIKEIKPQHKIILDVNGKHITTHIVDFLVTLNDGRKKFVEIKGFPTDVWKIKAKLTQALFPKTEYLINPSEKQLLK